MNRKNRNAKKSPTSFRPLILPAISVVALAAALWMLPSEDSPTKSEPQPEPMAEEAIAEVPPVPEVAPVAVPTQRRDFELKAGQALVDALQDQGISREQAGKVALALEGVFDARKLRAGQAFRMMLEPAGAGPGFVSLSFKVGVDRRIVIELGTDGLIAEERAIPHVRHIEARSLVVKGSLTAAAAAAEVPQDVILEIVQQLGHRVDFQRDLREGDQIDLTYERFVHPEDGLEHPGGLISARLLLSDRDPLEIYRYETGDGIVSFYNRDGVSIETELARTPVVGGFLTSSYGPRKHPVLRVMRMHRGMDFAAPKGSAVVAVRAGRIDRASRNGSFGKYVRIDHGKGLETAYAHLSNYREGLKKGDWVEQGAVIGYVGESGLATSPNLHYEVLKGGKQVDPRAIDLPPRVKLQDEDLAKFRQLQQELQAVSEQSGNTASG